MPYTFSERIRSNWMTGRNRLPIPEDLVTPRKDSKNLVLRFPDYPYRVDHYMENMEVLAHTN
jgi:hypothetical protein